MNTLQKDPENQPTYRQQLRAELEAGEILKSRHGFSDETIMNRYQYVAQEMGLSGDGISDLQTLREAGDELVERGTKVRRRVDQNAFLKQAKNFAAGLSEGGYNIAGGIVDLAAFIPRKKDFGGHESMTAFADLLRETGRSSGEAYNMDPAVREGLTGKVVAGAPSLVTMMALPQTIMPMLYSEATSFIEETTGKKISEMSRGEQNRAELTRFTYMGVGSWMEKLGLGKITKDLLKGGTKKAVLNVLEAALTEGTTEAGQQRVLRGLTKHIQQADIDIFEADDMLGMVQEFFTSDDFVVGAILGGAARGVGETGATMYSKFLSPDTAATKADFNALKNEPDEAIAAAVLQETGDPVAADLAVRAKNGDEQARKEYLETYYYQDEELGDIDPELPPEDREKIIRQREKEAEDARAAENATKRALDNRLLREESSKAAQDVLRLSEQEDLELDVDDSRVVTAMERLNEVADKRGLKGAERDAFITEQLVAAAKNQGITYEQMLANIDRMRILGESTRQNLEDVLKYRIELNAGNDADTVFEEATHTEFKRYQDRVGKDRALANAREWKRQYEEETGEVTHGDTDTDIDEWLARKGLPWYIRNHKDPNATKTIPRGILDFLKRFVAKFKSVFDDADVLREMERKGTLNPEFRAFLQSATGQEDSVLDEDVSYQMEPEIKDTEELTEEDIENGAESESGAVADVEIDDEVFDDDSAESFSIVGDVPEINRSDLKGRSKFVYFSDQMRVGVYTGLDPESGIEIDLQGGPLYPYMEGHKGNAGWAFTTEGMFTRFNTRVNETDGIGLTTLYSKENLRANATFLKAYIAEVRHAIKSKKLTKKAFLEAANAARKQVVSQSSVRDGKRTFKVSRDSEAYKLFNKNFRSVEDFEAAMALATFEVRGAMLGAKPKMVTRNGKRIRIKGELSGEKLGAVKNVKKGLPDIVKMIDMMADPTFTGLSHGTIVGAIQFEQGQTKPADAKAEGIEQHGSYPVVIKGRGLGILRNPIHVAKVLKVKKSSPARYAETKMAGVSFQIAEAAFDSAKERMGTTQDLKEAGYILPDGTMLDFSGKRQGGISGVRYIDHRDIDFDGVETEEQWSGMVQFMGMGAIRIDANAGLISTHGLRNLTQQQIRRIEQVAMLSDGAYLDMEDGDRRIGMEIQNPKKVIGMMRRFLAGEDLETGPAFQMRINDLEAGFYSQLERVLDQKIQGKAATVQQVMALASPKNGVKPEEVKWSGIEQWLDDNAENGKVQTADLMAYLRDVGRVRFEEVSMSSNTEIVWEGDELFVNGVSTSLFIERDGREFNVVNGDGDILNVEPLDSIEEAKKEAEEEAQSMIDDAESSERIGLPQYEQYQIPNGANYREVVLTMPVGEGKEEQWSLAYKGGSLIGSPFSTRAEAEAELKDLFAGRDDIEIRNAGNFEARDKSEYTSSHFTSIPNYVAHMRLNEREIASKGFAVRNTKSGRKGKVFATREEAENDMKRYPESLSLEVVEAEQKMRGLFIEEIQSDRHQQGRDKGYADDAKATKTKRADGTWHVELADGTPKNFYTEAEADQFIANYRSKGIPDAPFRKDWQIQMFKRALRDAVASGKDWIGWTVGETQADRYDLSEKIREIAVEHHDSGRVFDLALEGSDPDGMTMVNVDKSGVVIDSGEGSWIGKNLDEVLGKELAEKLMSAEDGATLSGEDFKIGGEGMKGFYDKILVSAVNKYISKWGGKVESGEIETGTELEMEKYRNGGAVSGSEAMDALGIPEAEQRSYWANLEPAERDRILQEHRDRYLRISDAGNTAPIHKVMITEAMRESVKAGQPAFQISEPIPESEGGKLPPATWETLAAFGYKASDAGGTQISTTAATYQKIAEDVDDDELVLDYASGLGAGTVAMREAGKKIKGYEPFSSPDRRVVKPDYTKQSQLKSDSYDVVVLNAVLNVVPQDTRVEILQDVYRVLKEGGRAYINLMGWTNIKGRLNNPKTKLVGPREVITGKGTFQKGYTQKGFEDFVQQVLPDAQIEKSKFGDVKIVLRKPVSQRTFQIAPPVETFGERPKINIADIKAYLLGEKGWDDDLDLYAKLDKYYGGKIPIFHATDDEFVDDILKTGLKPVDFVNNRKRYGSASGYYFQVGLSGYWNADATNRNRLLVGYVNGEFLQKHAEPDTDSISSDSEVLEELGITDKETIAGYDFVESDIRALIAALVDRDGDFSGIEFFVDEDYEPPVVPVKEVKTVEEHDSFDPKFQIAPPVDNPAFDAWFGDSKVVDENGEPMIVYHGTDRKFDAFNPDTFGDRTILPEEEGIEQIVEEGFFFTSSRQSADWYAMRGGFDGNVMSLYLSIQNPLVIENFGEWSDVKVSQAISKASAREHDGVILKGVEELHGTEDQYIAFEPTQIKSATDNRGTYNPNDPRISFQMREADEELEHVLEMDRLARKVAAIEKRRLEQIRELHAQGMDVTEKLEQLDNVRKTLPTAIRHRLGGDIQISRRKTATGRQNELNRRIQRAVELEQRYEAQRRKNWLRKTLRRFGYRGQKSQKQAEELTARVRDFLQVASYAANVDTAQRVRENVPKPMTMSEAEYDQTIIDFLGILDGTTKDAGRIEAAYYAVQEFMRSGKYKRAQFKEEQEAIAQDRIERGIDTIAQGDPVPDANEQRASNLAKSKFKRAMEKIRFFLFDALNGLEQHMNILDGERGGMFTQEIFMAAQEAKELEATMQREHLDMTFNEILELLGGDFEKAQAWFKAAEEVVDTDIEFDMGDGMKKRKLSIMQAIDILNQWKDESLRPTFAEMGIDESTIQRTEKFVGENGIKLSEYLRSRYAEIGLDIRAKHEEVEGYPQDLVDGYGGKVTRANVSKEDEESMLEFDSATGRATVKTGSFKARSTNTYPIVWDDAMQKFLNHMHEANHYISHAQVARTLTKTFGKDSSESQQLRRAIIKKHGQPLMDAIDENIERIIGGTFNQSRKMWGLMDQIRGDLTKGTLMLKPDIMIKQLTSAPAFLEELGAKAYAEAFAKAAKDYRKWVPIIMQSNYVKNRLSNSQFADIQDQINMRKSALRKWRWDDVLMINVKAGDIGAILMGGIPVYVHYYAQAKAKGRTDAQAKAYAELMFGAASDRAQQASSEASKGFYLGSNNYGIGRTFFMYLTSPMQYQRNVNVSIYNFYKAIQAASKGKKVDTKKIGIEAARAVIVYHFLLPQIFQAVASGLSGLGDDDEITERFWKRQLRAAMLGNVNVFPAVGQMLTALGNNIVGLEDEKFFGSSGSPMVDFGGKASGRIANAISEPSGENLTKVIEDLAQLRGIPLKQVTEQYEAIQEVMDDDTDFPIQRLLGWSKWALGEED
jgi:SAM-dependent methyltransferase